MEVFHYTHDYNWRCIKSDKDLGVEGEMKGPLGWTFALLEPEPQAWINNPQFPNLWENLMKRCGRITFPGEVVYTDRLVLLAIVVDVNNPNIFVGDRGIWEIAERDLGSDIAQTELGQQAQDSYYGSRVPLTEYLDRKEKLGYLLPEVQIGEPIPLTRVRHNNYQPALERYIQSRSRGDLLTQKRMAKWEAEFLGLEDWYIDYCARKPEIKMRLSDYLQLYARRLLHKLNLA